MNVMYVTSHAVMNGSVVRVVSSAFVNYMLCVFIPLFLVSEF